MNLIAIIPAGLTSVTVNGLHQWDYGRGLNIVADGLPRLVEVHFEYAGITEAPVRVAEATDSMATVIIPDQCLEQTTPIKAWVYLKGDASGRTALEITLPIIPRAKPAAVGTSDDEARAATRYDELFSLTGEALAKYAAIEGEVERVQEAAEKVVGVDAKVSAAETAATSAANSASDAAAAADRAESVIPFIDSTYLHHPCGRSPVETFDFVNQEYKIYAPFDDSTAGVQGKRHGTLFLACGYYSSGGDLFLSQFLFFWDGISKTEVHGSNTLTFVADAVSMLSAQYIVVSPTGEFFTEDGRRYNEGIVKFYQTWPGAGEQETNPSFDEVRIVPLTTWG